MKRLLLGAAVAFVFSTVAISAAPRTDAVATIDLIVPSFASTTSSGTAGIWPRLGDSVTFNVSDHSDDLHHTVLAHQL